MGQKLFILLVALLLQSCATQTPKTDELSKNSGSLARSRILKSIPFIKQTVDHCGPASLKMILGSYGQKASLQELTGQLYTPGKKGTLTTDMSTAIKRQGMLGLEVHDLKSLLTEIEAGHPVLVFQNLGFSWYPSWHFAVALGYDLDGPDLILHSGKNKFLETDMRSFERSWSLAEFWAVVVLPPGELSKTGDDLIHVNAISALERLGKLSEAEIGYEAVLKKWPQSLSGLIGMGNVLFEKKEFKDSVKYLEVASLYHPSTPAVWHNLATAQGAAGNLKGAKVSALKAVSLVTGDEKKSYTESLKAWLP